MAGRSCISLLVACFLILVTPASLSHGQDARLDVIEREAGSTNSRFVTGLRSEFEWYRWAGEGGRVPFPPILIPKLPLPVGVGPTFLQQMTRAAGTIFSGTVTSVARMPATSPQSLGTIVISFHVERAIRGVRAGQNLTIHEWMGLWTSGQRYRVGEHVLLFLFPPSKLGLTSSVGGAMGRFGVDTAGRVVIGPHIGTINIGTIKADRILAGKARVNYEDFVRAIRRASEEE